MDMSTLEDTGLSLSLGSGPTSAIIATHRRHNPISFDASTLTLSLSDVDPIVSSPHSTVSSFSTAYPTSVKKEEIELVEERGSSRAGVDDEDDEDGSSARKKLRLTKDQSALLEDRFKEHSTLNPKQKQALAKQLNLRPRQVEVWFQNRRARTKLKQTEVDCEFLKRCCETLTDENRRLQKEVSELRAMKFAAAAPLYMQLPASTLAMCPSCQRVTAGEAKPHFFNPFTHHSAAR